MLLRRIGWHLRRVRGRIDRRTALGLLGLLVGTIVAAAAIVTVVEGPRTILVALVRDGKSQVNPPADFVVEDGDQALVIAESMDALLPVQQLA